MNHLSDAQLSAHVLDHMPLSDLAATHLQSCDHCQREFRGLVVLNQHLEVARRCHVSPGQLQRYAQLFEHVQQKPSPLARLAAHVMSLAQDSRQRMGLQGLRSGGNQSYRLLYSASAADVELLVKPQGAVCSIEGEVLPLDEDQWRAPVLVELSAATPGAEALDLSAESNAQGYFHLSSVTLGYYDLVITPSEGPFLQIKGIDIT